MKDVLQPAANLREAAVDVVAFTIDSESSFVDLIARLSEEFLQAIGGGGYGLFRSVGRFPNDNAAKTGHVERDEIIVTDRLVANALWLAFGEKRHPLSIGG